MTLSSIFLSLATACRCNPESPFHVILTQYYCYGSTYLQRFPPLTFQGCLTQRIHEAIFLILRGILAREVCFPVRVWAEQSINAKKNVQTLIYTSGVKLIYPPNLGELWKKGGIKGKSSKYTDCLPVLTIDD